MKQLTCEMCGSNDLVKQDGVFVCQSCGCKYSVEEAKKMMVEGTVEVTGTVKIDNTDQLNKYKELAQKAYEAGSTDEAYNYYLKVLEITPTDYEAIFYKGMCIGWTSTIAVPRVDEAFNAYVQAIENIPHEDEETSELAFSIMQLYSVELARLLRAWFDMARQNYWDVDEWYDVNINTFWTYLGVAEQCLNYFEIIMPNIMKCDFAIKQDIATTYCDCCHAMCSHVVQYLDYSQSNAVFPGLKANMKRKYVDMYDNMVYEIRKDNPSFNKTDSKYGVIDRMDPPTRIGMHNERTTDINYQKQLEADRIIAEKIKKYKETLAQQKIKEYWDAHPDEKKQLDERMAAINAEVKQLKSEIEPYEGQIREFEKEKQQQVPAESNLKSLNDKISELQQQKKALGLFKGKQKKEIQGQIDGLTIELQDVEKTVRLQKDELHKSVDSKISSVKAEMKPYADKISELEKEKNNIINELKKPR